MYMFLNINYTTFYCIMDPLYSSFVYETLDFNVIKTTNLNWIAQFQTDVQSYSRSFVITATSMTENLPKRFILIMIVNKYLVKYGYRVAHGKPTVFMSETLCYTLE